MKSNTLLKLNSIYIIDLILVSLWALFALFNSISVAIILLPFVVIRLAAVFCLQLRERKAIVPIIIFAVAAFSALALDAYDFNAYIFRPFARMYDYAAMFFEGHSTMIEGAYHYYGNHGDAVSGPGKLWYIFIYGYAAWLVLVPIFIYLYLSLTGTLRQSRWRWKKITGIAVFYLLLGSVILCVRCFNASILPGIGRTLWLGLLFVPLIANIRWKSLSLWLRRYIIVAGLFVLAVSAGLYMQSMASLIAIWVSVPAFYYFVGCYKWRKPEIKTDSNIYLLLLSGTVFWTAQYALCFLRVAMLFVSIGLATVVAYRLWRTSGNVISSFTLFLVCALILPSIALGYNQFNCLESRRLNNFTCYEYSPLGLLNVTGSDGVGIRDRFGYVIPAEYDWVESMGNPSKPFVRFKADGFWGVYDLERQKVVVEPKYNDILHYDKNSWRLMDEYAVRYGCHDFFVSPNSYYRYRGGETISDCPFIHGLEDELPLKYNCEVKGAYYLDYLLTEMMTKLWEKPDSVSYADFYWDWTVEVNGIIEDLQSKAKVFDEDGDYSSETMQKLEEYIEPGCGGSQMAMNATSYVLSTIENYRMLQAVQDLDCRLSPIDMRREYTLFNEFMSAYEDWEDKRDEFKDWYSDRPRERNAELYARLKDRHKSVDDMRAVVKGDTVIHPVTAVSQSAIDGYFNQLASIGNDETKELVAPIKQKFNEWIDYRNQIVSAMPLEIAVSYSNQTRQLEKFYTSNEFIYEDEL